MKSQGQTLFFTFRFGKCPGVINFLSTQSSELIYSPFVACRNNGGAIHLSGEMGSSSLSSLKPIQILRAQNIRCNMNTVFLKIIYTCILSVKGKIQRFTLKNRRSLSGSRRARNNFSGSFQNTLLKIMKTEELSVFGNYLLFICFTIPDVVNKCLKAALRLYNFL